MSVSAICFHLKPLNHAFLSRSSLKPCLWNQRKMYDLTDWNYLCAL